MMMALLIKEKNWCFFVKKDGIRSLRYDNTHLCITHYTQVHTFVYTHLCGTKRFLQFTQPSVEANRLLCCCSSSSIGPQMAIPFSIRKDCLNCVLKLLCVHVSMLNLMKQNVSSLLLKLNACKLNVSRLTILTD